MIALEEEVVEAGEIPNVEVAAAELDGKTEAEGVEQLEQRPS